MNKKAGVSLFGNWLSGRPAPAYLLYGGGAGLAGLLVREWEKKLRGEGASFEIFRWTMADKIFRSKTANEEGDKEKEPLALPWRSPSFFASERIFVLPDLAEMKEKKEKKKKTRLDEIREYLASPEPSATLILHGTDYRQAKSFAATPNVAAMEPREAQAIEALAGYAVNAAKDANISMSRDCAAFLARFTACDFEAFDAELLKLFAYAAGKDAITNDDVRAVCVFRGEVDPFQLAEALALKDAAAIAMLRRFAQSAKDEDYHKLTGQIAWRLRESVHGRKGGVSVRRAARLFEVLSRIDREIKGESRLSPRQVYEIRLLSVLI